MNNQSMKLFFCGDIMPGGVLPYQDSFVDSRVKSFLEKYDYRIGTLECAIGTNIPFESTKLKENGGNNNVVFARNEDFFRLVDLGINVVSLGNNHAYDLGEAGLLNTISLLNKYNIIYFGAGMNIEEASRPAVLTTDVGTIALLGCCLDYPHAPKVNAATPFSSGVWKTSIADLQAHIVSCKKNYDFVVVMPHWGEEHIFFPPWVCAQYAQMMVDAGADAIFGSHSHCLSSNIKYNGKPIFFGMGNFLFPDYVMQPPRPFYYPESKEALSTMRHCVNYPKSISENMVSDWSEDCRIGMGVEAVFSPGSLNCSSILFRMGNDNILRKLADDNILKYIVLKYLLLPLGNFVTSVIPYSYLHNIVNKLSRRRLRHLGDFKKNL